MSSKILSVIISGNAKGAIGALNDVDGKLGGVGNSFGKLAMISAAAMASVGAAVGAAAIKGVQDYAGFERRMNSVFTLLPGISKDAMGKMENDVLSLGRKYGVLTTETVPALYEALSSGIPQENVFEFLEVAIKSSKAGLVELDVASKGIVTVMNAYGHENMSAAKASDIMFQVVKFGTSTFDELANQMYDVVPVSSALGIAFEEVGAGLAALSLKGTPARVATTQIRSALVELTKEAGEKSAFAKFKEASGKTFPEFVKAGGTMQGAFKILADQAKKTNTPLIEMFSSVEAGQGFVGLTSDGMESFNKILVETQGAAGSTQSAFDQMNQGLLPVWEKMKAGAEGASIAIGKFIAPHLMKLITVVETNLPKAIKFAQDKWNEYWPSIENGFKRVRETAETVGDKLKGAFEWFMSPEQEMLRKAVAFTIGTIIVRALIGLTVALAGAAASVAISVGAFMALPLAIGAIAFAAMKAYENFGWFRLGVENLTTAASGFYGNVLVPMGSYIAERFNNVILPTLKDLLSWFINTGWPTLQATAQAFYENALRPLIAYIVENREQFKNLGIAVLVIVGVVIGAIAVFLAIGAVMTIVAAAVVSLTVVVVTFIFTAMMKMIQVGWDLFNNIRDALGGVIDWFENVIQVGWDMAKNLGSAVADVIRFFRDLPGNIVNATYGALRALENVGRDFVQGLMNGITGKWDELKNMIIGLANGLPDFIKGPLGIHSPSRVMMEVGGYIGEGMALGIDQSVPMVEASAVNLATSVTSQPVTPPSLAPAQGDADVASLLRQLIASVDQLSERPVEVTTKLGTQTLVKAIHRDGGAQR
jgi:TP901 family phage tail tape measure protein